jgi:hypothetical protein
MSVYLLLVSGASLIAWSVIAAWPRRNEQSVRGLYHGSATCPLARIFAFSMP